ncbi:MAG TPA: TPM domain-containing protein [Firmicutes bacterium]|nr:TPM domain-containing protein [Bacillota bacterium]
MKTVTTRIPAMLAAFLLCFSLILLPVAAASGHQDGLSTSGKNNPGGVDTSVKIYDYAGLLTPEQIQSLSEKLITTGEKRKMDLVIVTTDDTKGRSSRDYADDFYDYNGFGIGEEKNGVLLLIDMEHRNAWISTTGKAISVINSNRIDKILDDVAPPLTDGNYEKSCLAFINKTNHYLLDDQLISPQTFLIFVGISLAIGAIGVLIMVASNRLVKKGTQAGAYVTGEIAITGQNDIFLRSSVTRTAIPKNTSSGGGGSHTGSSGTSHGGGGRSF